MSSPLACFVAMRHRLMWWEPFFFCSDSGPSSSSFCRLYFVLRFWNHTFTWAREGGGTGEKHPGSPQSSHWALAPRPSWEPNGESEARILSSGQVPPGSGGPALPHANVGCGTERGPGGPARAVFGPSQEREGRGMELLSILQPWQRGSQALESISTGFYRRANNWSFTGLM